ncbi:hypothetical protein [Bacillus marasmi]|uniref:hypothetical protein n=1 Tax=Bacillus marasmi TaxID=1926279 RepID=UPI0011C917F4|nr:hypothetical protein [Bacillus marasmi]
MNRKYYRTLTLLIIVISLYFVVFRTRTATYFGEDQDWQVKVQSKLTGLNGSYTIKIHYKGEKSIQVKDYQITPFFEGLYESELINGQIIYECTDDCGYFDRNENLTFFIVWVEKGNQAEKMRLIKMIKIQ